jgi:hypothetical protein
VTEMVEGLDVMGCRGKWGRRSMMGKGVGLTCVDPVLILKGYYAVG